MATPAEWVEGARPRTLPAAFSPVIAGSAVAWFEGGFVPLLATLALVVALALQVGVNYANDYSDGIRGTDAARVGPLRLVGSGAATPGQVKAAALLSFAVAAVAGLGVVIVTGQWWLLVVGAAAIAAAWFYTGGPHPYGYAGLGELFVFCFFGLVAVTGTAYIQLGAVPAAAWWAAIAIGALACAILVANNLRDLAGDAQAGKRTLATRLGDRGTRWFFLALVVLATAGVAGVAATSSWWALLGLAMLPVLFGPTSAVLAGAAGRELIVVLKRVGFAELICAIGLAAGLMIA
ncbi:MAG: 1,4-dihydroxy-2-naphthoate polyprenyltransferase [Propionicimonas sp.]|uniref:1,4-dihydroxy-2-naphthoate polyprenyltransferase n=1 Tax=Propionicimonas sp. TaxID=1955623 RepID=UPI002B20C475|nr:1,4-dihydroxy-2-naphthoate polyprenyltransferase [Propionicimonas sp.]MEA4943796.1 1,4-dihydroxy-2-naphthoate polyprenyltransferase [Propionicimonas sp.]MEA5118982.1 1,4-dihydroxy-2-naphthoate polyprenyltransferase [Propionicimonas sp.]